MLSKYYPPDFDPSKVPRLRRPKNQETAVRFMLPMSVRCTECSSFMGQGLKFNAKKANTDETYLGIKIYRFSMRCKGCPITFYIKTDPKNGDYVCESGVKRNFEPWREKQLQEDAAKQERTEADTDTMIALENKTADAKKEMEELEELDTLKLIRSVQSNISPDELLAMKRKTEEVETSRAENEAEEEIRKAASQAFAAQKSKVTVAHERNTNVSSKFPAVARKEMKKREAAPRRLALKVSVKAKKFIAERKLEPKCGNTTETVKVADAAAGALDGLVDYGSSSEESDSE